jgi:pimeloyl-ACP methyl ester carboxylesterase
MLLKISQTGLAGRQSVLTNAAALAWPGEPLRTLTLSDGRCVAWSDFGNRHGFPVVYFPSQGGSRLEAMLLHEAALSAGFRLIAVDRPGIGCSTFRKLAGHTDMNDDVRAVLDVLGIAELGLMAWAGGSPYALAFGRESGAFQIRFINLLSPFPVMPQSESRLSKMLLSLLRIGIQLRYLLAHKKPAGFLAQAREQMCQPDQKLFDSPRINQILTHDAIEAARQGVRGVAADCTMSFKRWDFDPAGVLAPVHLWQGGADNLSVPCSALRLQSLVPGADLHTVSRQGHLFFLVAADDIFRQCRQILRSARAA